MAGEAEPTNHALTLLSPPPACTDRRRKISPQSTGRRALCSLSAAATVERRGRASAKVLCEGRDKAIQQQFIVSGLHRFVRRTFFFGDYFTGMEYAIGALEKSFDVHWMRIVEGLSSEFGLI